jgi:polar amino acid transport system substrate-binding protein
MKKRLIGWLTILFLISVAAAVVQASQTAWAGSIVADEEKQSDVVSDSGGQDRKDSREQIHVSDLNSPDVTLGVPIAGAADIAVREQLPLAQIVHYNDILLGYMDVASGRLDAFIYDEVQMKLSLENGVEGVRMLDGEYLDMKMKMCMGISPVPGIPDLENKANAFIAEMHESGMIDDMLRRWVWDAERTLPDIELPENPKYHLVVATSGIVMPFSYYEGDMLTGMDIEMAYRFAKWLGADLEFQVADYNGIIAAAISGKADIILANLQYTKEREESDLILSDELYSGHCAVAVRDDTQNGTQGSTQNVARDDTQNGTASAARPEYSTFKDLGGKTVSMLNGAPFEELVSNKAPDVKEFTFYNNNPDMLLALESGKTDAVLSNNAIADLAVNRNPELAHFPQDLQDGAFGFAFSKGDPRRDTWQAAFDAIPEEQIKKAWDKWTGSNESVKKLPEQDWPGLKGTVRVAACDTLEPMSYVGEGGALMGFDLEVLLMIARKLDVHVEFTGMEFSAILSSVQSGKADIGAGSIIITPEREEAADFVNYHPAAFVLIVRAAAEGDQRVKNTFWSRLAASFEKTFVREDRWKLFVEGVITTLLITLLSLLCGTVLGFLIFLLCRNGSRTANIITRICVWLVQGTPMVVLLMILYYIVLASVDINGAYVAVIGFTLTFGAAVFGLMKMGVGAVDQGQYEAAYALGHSNRHAFFKVILPQALPHVLPAYKGEVVGLIKATAVVGYIAVQDLTKMGDIVRSRTYEAFFPLIAVTVFYFLLEGLLGFLVSRIHIRFDPKRRSREQILKGVKTDD